MITMTLAEVAVAVGGRLDEASGEEAVTGSVEFDSRQIGTGGLFVALPGERVDGHDYAVQAVAQGATGVLAARPVGVPAVLVPDVLIQSHSASLALVFYTATQFPATFHGHIFAAEHGSWNLARRTGYKVIRVPVVNGKATGEYEDFMVGFVTPRGDVWGRPVGVATAADGSLLVTDDGSGTVWRVAHAGKK